MLLKKKKKQQENLFPFWSASSPRKQNSKLNYLILSWSSANRWSVSLKFWINITHALSIALHQKVCACLTTHFKSQTRVSVQCKLYMYLFFSQHEVIDRVHRHKYLKENIKRSTKKWITIQGTSLFILKGVLGAIWQYFITRVSGVTPLKLSAM